MIYFGRQSFKLFKDYISNKSQVLGLVRTLSFKSPYALENLYPKSNLKLFTPKTVSFVINFHCNIKINKKNYRNLLSF